MIKVKDKRVSHGAISGIALGLTMLSMDAGAATEMEEKVFKTPMPHTQVTEGTKLKADFVRLESDLTAGKIASKLAQNPREILSTCIVDRKKRGLPVKPPHSYPSFDLPGHIDTYVTPNRKISYVRSYAFRVNWENCSLVENEVAHATLSSMTGSCSMNLIERTAKGACNMEAHRKAPLWQRPAVNPDGLQAKLAEMEADPSRAATAAQLRKVMGNAAAVSGKKTVLGIECQVIGGPLGPACTSKSGLVLETGVAGVSESKAVQAELNASVSEAVFAPLGLGPLKQGK